MTEVDAQYLSGQKSYFSPKIKCTNFYVITYLTYSAHFLASLGYSNNF